MNKFTTDELRQAFLDFFKSKDHKIVASDSLVPADDPTLLFTGAGMNQFKPYFLGLKKDLKRAASSQKCVRTADLDRVGTTPYHHTFFEMLGNFSFGDYFKKEAIEWAWEFVTSPSWLGISKEDLWVSVYEEDEEAYQIWVKDIGLAGDRIRRFGQEDNFWPANAPKEGPNGPCGPCSEIYFGKKAGEGVELWNLVFTQFERQEGGKLIPLPQKNIDTGMGLERVSSVLQGVSSNFEIDLFKPLIHEISLISTNSSPARQNAIADHLRAVIFLIADGVLPSNEGRGYVVRKLIRRSVSHLRYLNPAAEPSLYRLVPVVVSSMKKGYPELERRRENIALMIQNEEKRFISVLDEKVPVVTERLKLLKGQDLKDTERLSAIAQISYEFYDTYGVPKETLMELVKAEGETWDDALFNREMESQRKRSRQFSKLRGDIFIKESHFLKEAVKGPTQFVGYQQTEANGVVVALVQNEKVVPVLKEGEKGWLVLDRTPFYAESGGQVGDMGVIEKEAAKIAVMDTQWLGDIILHQIEIAAGEIHLGDSVTAIVDRKRRSATMKNHTATHMLHAILREKLGPHVRQGGSLVSPEKLRFDFTHYRALDERTLNQIEQLVNEKIRANEPVEKREESKEKAIEEGAIAFFGDKYADKVRVISIGDYSKELCGGTHLDRTGDIGLFKIVSESSVQAGVRRIEAITGEAAFEAIKEHERQLEILSQELKVPEELLGEAVSKLGWQVKEYEKRLSASIDHALSRETQKWMEKAEAFQGVLFIVRQLEGADAEVLRRLGDCIRSKNQSFVALLGSCVDGKGIYMVSVSRDLTKKGIHAGELVKRIGELTEGSGGGRPELAIGGGKKIEALPSAFQDSLLFVKGKITA